MPGQIYDVVFTGDLAIAGGYSGGVRIIDMTDPYCPVLLATHPGGPVEALAVRDSTLFVTRSFEELEIVDISEPTNPVTLGRLDVPNTSPESLVVRDTFVFIGGSRGELYSIDISDTANPVVRDEYTDPLSNSEFVRILSRDSLLYVIDDRYGRLLIFDASDGDDLRLLGEVDSLGLPLGMTCIGDHIYIASATYGVLVFDVASPTAPTRIGQWDIDAQDVSSFDGRLFVLVRNQGVWVCDVSEPASPRFVMAYPPVGGGILRTDPQTGRTSAGYSDQYFLDLGEPRLDSIRDAHAVPDQVQDMVIDNSRAFVSTSDDTMVILDISDPDHIEQIGEYAIRGVGGRLDVKDDLVYLIDSTDGLQILDASSPENILRRGSFKNASQIRDVEVQDGVAYLAQSARGLTVLDVQDPNQPTELRRVPDQALDLVSIGDGVVFGARDNKLIVYDISTPSQPVIASVYETDADITSIVAVGKQVWVAGGFVGHRVVLLDATEPSEPVEVAGLVNDEYPTSLAYSAGMLSVTFSGYGGAVSVYDVTELSQVERVAYRIGGTPVVTGRVGDVLWSVEEVGQQIDSLDISSCDVCIADFDDNGVVDTRDIVAFLNAWSIGESSADFDDNGVVDTRDVIAFLNAWNTGCS